MFLSTYENAEAFLRETQDVLEQHEAANNLMLGISLRLAQGDPYGDIPPYLATVADEAGIVVAAVMTPPHGLVVYGDRADLASAPEMLLRDLLERGYPVPSVVGPQAVAGAFAGAWPTVSGQAVRPGMRQRAYELTQVIQPRYSPGHLRLAAAADLDLLAGWIRAFHAEALTGLEVDGRQMAERMLRRQDLFVWDDGRPVSMANRTRPIRHGISVSLVYTPPELRGLGYATSCVAALSQRLLDSGYRFCTLFTNLANPTSNAIYQRIGYRPIGDHDEWLFT